MKTLVIVLFQDCIHWKYVLLLIPVLMYGERGRMIFNQLLSSSLCDSRLL